MCPILRDPLPLSPIFGLLALGSTSSPLNSRSAWRLYFFARLLVILGVVRIGGWLNRYFFSLESVDRIWMSRSAEWWWAQFFRKYWIDLVSPGIVNVFERLVVWVARRQCRCGWDEGGLFAVWRVCRVRLPPPSAFQGSYSYTQSILSIIISNTGYWYMIKFECKEWNFSLF